MSVLGNYLFTIKNCPFGKTKKHLPILYNHSQPNETHLHSRTPNAALKRFPLDIIDVRTPAEFTGVHLFGARLKPLESLDCPATVAEHNKNQFGAPLYILCHSGARAKRAAAKFAQIGFEECVVVEGGTKAWEQAGLPVERGFRKMISLDRQLRLVMGTMVLSGVLLAQCVNPAWMWLSGFVGCGLIFARDHRHLSDAHYDFSDAVESRSTAGRGGGSPLRQLTLKELYMSEKKNRHCRRRCRGRLMRDPLPQTG